MTAATYRPSPMPEYAGNPLIEALLPIEIDDADLTKSMAIKPHFQPTVERALPAALRREMVSRLKALFIPLPPHLELFQQVATALRRSYTWRNPRSAPVQSYLHYPMEPKLTAEVLSARSAAGSVLFVQGLSGIGKSTGIEACLRALKADVIDHTEYLGAALIETQIVWIKVSCPEDRSLKTLCAKILRTIDTNLGKDGHWSADFLDDPRITGGALIRAVLSALANHHVGILVVDELQNLFASNGNASIELLNFLLTLRDESGLCLVMCGTYSSLHLLQTTFRLSRRIAPGVINLQRPSSGKDRQWAQFCKILWHYQWLEKPEHYASTVAETLFELTQGIRGVVISLFIRTQELLISSGAQTMTLSDLRQVWMDRFSMLEPAMSALRTNDVNAMAKWDDLMDSIGSVANLGATPPTIGESHTPAASAGSSTSSPTSDPVKAKTSKSGRGKRLIDPDLARLTEDGGLDQLRNAGLVGVPV